MKSSWIPKVSLCLGLFNILQIPAHLLLAQDHLIITGEYIFEEAPFRECHASTIVSTPESLVAAWFGGTEEKNEDVEIWLSRKSGKQWTAPESVANGIQSEDKRFPTWNPVLYFYPDGPLMLFYKVGPSPSEWWGEMKISHDYGKTWGESYRLPEGILGPVKNKPVLMMDGRLICPSSTENDGWKVHFEITRDKGEHWERVGPINDASRFNIIQPGILTYANGSLQILCRSMEGFVISSWSKDGGYTWTDPEPTELPNPNSGIDALTLKNGWQMVVYNHSERTKDAWGGPRTPLNVSISKDGLHWKPVALLEDQPGEYSYPAIIQSEDGLVHITYTYQRKTIKHVILDPGLIDYK